MSRRNCWLLFACGLLLGALVGGILVYGLKPNHFRVQVRNSRKLYLLATKGDIIEWVPDIGSKAHQPTVKVAGAPGETMACVEGTGKSIPRCTVNVSTGHYGYACDPQQPCFDPGWGGGHYIGPWGEFKDAFRFLFVTVPLDVYYKLFSPQAIVTEGPPFLANQAPYIYCDGGKANVNPNSLSTLIGSIIEWDSSTDSFAIKPSQGMCSEGTAQIGSGDICTVPNGAKGPYTYEVSMGGCKNPGTASLSVP
jgi:hypothetical protein